jgi:4-amino-4-deoxy-L-arabinose transferase-like glycosyltransferase
MRPTSRVAWVLIAAVLVTRLAATWRSGPPTIDGDTLHYHDIATHLAAGEGFAFSPSQQMPWQRDSLGTPVPTALRPPLFPIALSLFYRAGIGPQGVVLAQVLLAALTGWLLYRLARRVGLDDGESSIALALYLLYPPFADFTAQLVTENLFVPLILGSFLLLLRAMDRASIAEYAASGVLIGLAAMTRTTALIMPFVLCAVLAFLPRRRWAGLAALLAGSALVVLPWAVRNQRTFGHFEPSITMSGRNLFTGTYPPSGGSAALTDAQQPPELVASLTGLDEFQIDSVYTAAAVENLKRYPFEQVPLAAEKLARAWFQVPAPNRFTPSPRSLLLNGPLLVAGLLGCIALRSRRHGWVPAFVIVYSTLFQVLTIAGVRYSMFAWPFVFMGVGAAVLAAAGVLRPGRTGTTGTA